MQTPPPPTRSASSYLRFNDAIRARTRTRPKTGPGLPLVVDCKPLLEVAGGQVNDDDDDVRAKCT